MYELWINPRKKKARKSAKRRAKARTIKRHGPSKKSSRKPAPIKESPTMARKSGSKKRRHGKSSGKRYSAIPPQFAKARKGKRRSFGGGSGGGGAGVLNFTGKGMLVTVATVGGTAIGTKIGTDFILDRVGAMLPASTDPTRPSLGQQLQGDTYLRAAGKAALGIGGAWLAKRYLRNNAVATTIGVIAVGDAALQVARLVKNRSDSTQAQAGSAQVVTTPGTDPVIELQARRARRVSSAAPAAAALPAAATGVSGLGDVMPSDGMGQLVSSNGINNGRWF